VTDSGYGHVLADPANATYSETADGSIRSFRKAYVYQESAYVGGPSPIAGKSRIGRVDLRDPAHPTLALSLDVDGNFAGFAYDGSSPYLLEIKGNDGSGAARAVVYLENQGRLTLTTEGTMMPSFGNVSRFFARDRHAYLLEGGLASTVFPERRPRHREGVTERSGRLTNGGTSCSTRSHMLLLSSVAVERGPTD